MPIVEFVTADGYHLLVNTRPQAISIMVDERLSLTFDREGRLIGAWLEGRNYRRGFDNRILEKQAGSEPGLSNRIRRELDADAAHIFLTDAYARLAEYRARVNDAATRVANGASADDCAIVRAALDHAVQCTPERLDAERITFQQIYKPISILPPDQYLALVLQATEGCSYNHCAFCSLYRDRSFRIKPLAEFQHHIRAVNEFFGTALNLRKTIFLADANALVIPQDQLLPILDTLNTEYAIQPRDLDQAARSKWKAVHPVSFEGIYSFVDAFTTRRKTADDYAELAARGVRRVYIGLESGDPALLKLLGKPNTPDDVLELVRTLKAGGIDVGIIILAGAGGAVYANAHVQHTAEIINAMSLGKNDLIYFSELVDFPGSEYSALVARATSRALTIDEIGMQMRDTRARFGFDKKRGAPKISYYDIREFIY